MTPEPLWFCLTASQRKFILSKIDDPRQFDADLQQLIFGTGGLVQACHMGFEHLSSVMGPGFGEFDWIPLCWSQWDYVGRYCLIVRLCLGIIGRNRWYAISFHNFPYASHVCNLNRSLRRMSLLGAVAQKGFDRQRTMDFVACVYN